VRIGRIVVAGACISAVLALAASDAAWSSAPPTVTAVRPYWGWDSGGANVNISGSNFEGAAEVRFGSTPATEWYVASPSLIAVTSPPGIGTVDVTVTTPEGTSTINTADDFTYRQIPEYGRCIKGFVGYGEYAKATCKGGSEFPNYFWFPAFAPKKPLQKRHFTIAGGEVKLKTTGRKLISCTGASGGGEYTAGQEAAVDLVLTGCHSTPLGSCQSEAASEGELRLSTLTGLIGHILSSTMVGQQLSPAGEGAIAEFSCSGTPVTLSGAVVGKVKAGGLMLVTTTWKAAQKGGVQAIPNLTGGPEATLQMKIGVGPLERTGLTASLTQTNEEAIEIISER
jgi:hypothetical protein